MFKVRQNKKSVTAKITKGLEGAEDEIKQILYGLADDLADRTRVDTGAYAESFSVDTSGGRSIRRVSPEGRPQNQELGVYQNIARNNMKSDIDRIEPLQHNRVIFKNGAPHANILETKYQIFGSVRDIYKGK